MSRQSARSTTQPRYEDAANCIDFNLRRASRALTIRYNQILAPSGLLITQFSLLALLRAHGGSLSITHFAQMAGMDRTTLSRNIKPLERRGFVHITPDLTDRRVQIVELAGDGQVALDAAWPLWQAAQEQVQTLLGNDRRAHLLAELQVLATLQPS